MFPSPGLGLGIGLELPGLGLGIGLAATGLALGLGLAPSGLDNNTACARHYDSQHLC